MPTASTAQAASQMGGGLPRFAELPAISSTGSGSSHLRFPKVVWPAEVGDVSARSGSLLLLDIPRKGSWRGIPGLFMEKRGEARHVSHVVVHPRDGLPCDFSHQGRCVDRPLLAYSRELTRSLVAWATSADARVGKRQHGLLEDEVRRYVERASLDWFSHWGWPDSIDLRQIMASVPLDQADLLRRRATTLDPASDTLGHLLVPLLAWSQQPGLYGLSRLLVKGSRLPEKLSTFLGVPEGAASRLLATVSVAANACGAIDRGALFRLAMLHHLAPRSPLHAHAIHLGAAIRRLDRELNAFGGAPIWQWIQALRVRRHGLNNAIARCIPLSGASDPDARKIRWWLRYLRAQLASAGLEGRMLDVLLSGWISETDVFRASGQFADAFNSPPLDLRGFRAESVIDGDCIIGSTRVKPLLTVDELVEEGRSMEHCIGSMNYQYRLLDGHSVYFALHDIENDQRATLRISCDKSFLGHYELAGARSQKLDGTNFLTAVASLQSMVKRNRTLLGSAHYRKLRWEFGVLPLPRQGNIASQLRWAEKQAAKLRIAEFFSAIENMTSRSIRRQGPA